MEIISNLVPLDVLRLTNIQQCRKVLPKQENLRTDFLHPSNATHFFVKKILAVTAATRLVQCSSSVGNYDPLLPSTAVYKVMYKAPQS